MGALIEKISLNEEFKDIGDLEEDSVAKKQEIPKFPIFCIYNVDMLGDQLKIKIVEKFKLDPDYHLDLNKVKLVSTKINHHEIIEPKIPDICSQLKNIKCEIIPKPELCSYRWSYQSNKDPWKYEGLSEWENYSDDESKLIEKEYISKSEKVELMEYRIIFAEGYQEKIGEITKRRRVRRTLYLVYEIAREDFRNFKINLASDIGNYKYKNPFFFMLFY